MIGFTQVFSRFCHSGTLRGTALVLTLFASAVFIYWRGYDAAADDFKQAALNARLERQELQLALLDEESEAAEADGLALRSFEDDFKIWHASDCLLDDGFLNRLREAFPQNQ